MVVFYSLPASISLLLCLLFTPNPSRPPEPSLPILPALKLLLKTRNFNIAFLSFGLVIGLVWAVTTVLDPILSSPRYGKQKRIVNVWLLFKPY